MKGLILEKLSAGRLPVFLAMIFVIMLSAARPTYGAGLTAPGTTPYSVTLTWTAPGDDSTTGTASQYDIRYSLAPITELNWHDANQAAGEPSPQPAGSQESFDVTGLQPGTTYYFAIKTADEVPNWSGISNVASGTTLEVPTVPDPPVLAGPGNGTTDLTPPVLLDWNNVMDVDSYGVQIDDDASFGSVLIDSVVTVSELSASDFSEGTTYYWRVRAHNDVGWGDYSAAWNFTTACPLPGSPVPASPDSGVSNLNMPVYLDWSDVSGALQYQVQVDETAAFSNPVISTATSSSHYSASGLDDSRQYYWRVRAENNCGWGDWSAVWAFSTGDTTVPTGVADLGATPTENDGEILLSWTATGDDGSSGTASLYDIRYSLSTITEANWGDASQVSGEPTPQSAGNAETFVVGGLTSGVTYYFAIRVADEASNWSQLSNVAGAVPDDHQPPAAIDDLSAETGSDEGLIHLSWTAPGDDGDSGIASAYLLKYSQNVITGSNWDYANIYEEYIAPLPSGQEQSFIMTDLQPGVRYYIAMKTYDESGNGSEMSNVAVCTSGVSWPLDVDDGQIAAVSPVSGSDLRTSRPTLAVTNIGPGPDNEYYFEVASDSFFISTAAVSPPVSQMGGDITFWKVDERLEAGVIYYWRARANDNGYTVTSSFTVHPEAHAYPNPFYLNQADAVTFTEIPAGADFFITTVSGSIVREWSNLSAEDLTWDGTNQSGQRVASGTYLWFVTNSDLRGKLVVIR
jgi:hypothetical protein